MSETKQEKWDRGKTLFLESVHKPDHELRGCAHNQQCFHELMEICLLYTSPSPRDRTSSRMPSSA